MPRVKLISIDCHKTEDNAGKDETYIKAKGEEVWSAEGGMNDGDSRYIGTHKSITFHEKVKIEVWDRDLGHFPDKDDKLGTRYAYSYMKGAGEIELYYQDDGANYTLTIRVE